MSRTDYHGVTDQRKAAVKRLRDARALHRAGATHARCAMYLAGYAAECKLKAVLMEANACRTLADLAARLGPGAADRLYDHSIEALVNLLPNPDRLRRSPAWPGVARDVFRWRASWRYDPDDGDPETARRFIESVADFTAWLDANV